MRLLRRADFQRIYQSGRRFGSPMFTAFAERGDGPEQGTRVGFTTPRGLGKAVVRNRIRRRLREAVRLHLAELGGGWDVVFNPRPPVRQAPFEVLETEVVRLFEKLK